MMSIDQFKCRIGKFQISCELHSNIVKFRAQSLADFLLYQSTYNNDTLPFECKVFFSQSVAKLFNYIKEKSSSRIKFSNGQITIALQLMGQQKNLPLHLQRKQLSINDYIHTIQGLNQSIEALKQKNIALLMQKKNIQEKLTNLQLIKNNQQIQFKKQNDSQAETIKKLQNELKSKDLVSQLVKKLKEKPHKEKPHKEKPHKESSDQYDSCSSQQEQQNKMKGSKSATPNMSCVKDQFVIVWKQKKDILDKIEHLSRNPDCLTVKINGKQGQNGNQGIRELSQILPRVHQLKNIVVLNLYFNNNKFGKGVSPTFWQVLRATIIAHLKIKYVNFIIGPKTWRNSQKILQKQIQLYPKKIVVNSQIQGWK